MYKFTENLHILGLRKKEIAVYTTLSVFGTLNVTKIAQRAKVSRTTAGPILKRLKEKGLVREVRIGGHNEWKANDVVKVRGRVNTAFDELQSKIVPGILGPILESIDAKDIGIKVFRGKKQLYEAYKNIAQKPHRKMLGIQGAQFVGDYKKRVFERQSEMAAHRMLAENDVIYEGVMTKESLMMCYELDTQYLKSAFGRAMNVYLVPREVVDFAGEIVILENIVLFSIPKDMLMISVEHPVIVKALQSFFNILKQTGSKLDTYKFLQELLESRGDS